MLKEDCQLFSKLFLSCQSREYDLQEFYCHENQQFPASLSEGGKLYTCQISQLAAILQSHVGIPDTEPEVDTIIIDGSALVNVDEARLDMFARKQRPYEAIPATQAALLQHAKHAAYEAGCI